jgi:hypothetical protein
VTVEKAEIVSPLPFQAGSEPAAFSALVTLASGRIAPLRVEGRVSRQEGAFVMDGSIGLPGGGFRLPLHARYLVEGSRAAVTLGPGSVEFRPEGLQPKALGEALAMVERATGGLAVSARAAYDPGAPVQGVAEVALRDLSAQMAAGAIEGLGGTVRLSALFPPRTAGPQALSARRLVAGLPLEAPSVRFALEPSDAGTVVVIERAEARLAEGVVTVEGARFDPAAARQTFAIGLDGLSLDRLLQDYAMEGLSGSGRLSGIIPVAVTAAGVTIEAGTVQAKGGGVLRVDWGSSRQALVQQGESVALTVQALEDFRYSTLRVTIDRPAEDSLSIKVAMEGRNPAVRDGYPFRFNISLSGELEKILAAVQEGRRLGSSLLDGSLGGAP